MHSLKYYLITLVTVIFVGCSDGENWSEQQAERCYYLNRVGSGFTYTEQFVNQEYAPNGIKSVIVIDTIYSDVNVLHADKWFENLDKMFQEDLKTRAFHNYGVFVYVTPRNSMVQVRVGKNLKKYLSMKGVIAGAEYMRLQKQAMTLGVDSICPTMMRTVWNEIRNYQDMNTFQKIQYELSLSWFGDVLCDWGNPMESISSGFASFMARIIGWLFSTTNSMFITICLLALLAWILDDYIEKLLSSIPNKNKPTMLVGHVNNLKYIVKLIINAIIVTPSLATFAFFSNMRMEDVMYLKARNMPFMETINWEEWTSFSIPTILLAIMLGILYYLCYIMSPQRLLTYYLTPTDKGAYGAFYVNDTLKKQCANICVKGKWEFRIFLGIIIVYVGILLIDHIITFIMFIGGIVAAVFLNGDDSDNDVQIPEGLNTPVGDKTYITEESPNNTFSWRKPLGVRPSSDDDAEINLSGSGNRINDEDNFLKTLAGMGISNAVARKLPRNFWYLPFNFTMEKVMTEGAILAILMVFFAPLVLSDALITIFVISYLAQFLFSSFKEYRFAQTFKKKYAPQLKLPTSYPSYLLHERKKKELPNLIRFLLIILLLIAAYWYWASRNTTPIPPPTPTHHVEEPTDAKTDITETPPAVNTTPVSTSQDGTTVVKKTPTTSLTKDITSIQSKTQTSQKSNSANKENCEEETTSDKGTGFKLEKVDRIPTSENNSSSNGNGFKLERVDKIPTEEKKAQQSKLWMY